MGGIDDATGQDAWHGNFLGNDPFIFTTAWNVDSWVLSGTDSDKFVLEPEPAIYGSKTILDWNSGPPQYNSDAGEDNKNNKYDVTVYAKHGNNDSNKLAFEINMIYSPEPEPQPPPATGS